MGQILILGGPLVLSLTIENLNLPWEHHDDKHDKIVCGKVLPYLKYKLNF